MKLSIVIPVLNSHEIVKRQNLHFGRMNVDVEILFIDDGSEPPIDSPYVAHRTNDYRPWTWALARNKGAKIAKGQYLLMFDLDYIITEDVIRDCLEFNKDYRGFKRQFGCLDENGNLVQTVDELVKWGWPKERYAERGFDLPPHPNNFLIRKEKFFEMGMFREDLVERPYPQGEDRHFKKTRMRWEKEGRLECDWESRPTLYMFPNGQFCGDVDYNPFGMFHDLSRKTDNNYWFKKQNERSVSHNSGA